MEKLTVYAVGVEQQSILGTEDVNDEPMAVAEFAQPVLISDNARIARLSSAQRDAVISLYESYPRRVEYLQTGTDWSPHLYPRVWCPSIDTIFCARGLKRLLTPSVRSFAEVGCGSGFLTKFALEHLGQLERAVASDINLEAIRCTSDNLSGSVGREKVHLVLPDASSQDLALTGTYDLLVSNPPYIPRVPAHGDNPYEGLGLVSLIAQEARQLLNEGGQVLLNLSSLAGNEPLQWFESRGWQVTQMDTMRVPLKVNPVTSGLSRESLVWREYLESQGRIEIDSSEASGYRYWHTLRLLLVE